MHNQKFGKISYCQIASVGILYVGISSIFPPIYGYLGNIDVIFCALSNLILLLISLKFNSTCYKSRNHVFITVITVIAIIAIPYVTGNAVWANRYMNLLFFITAPLMFRLFYKFGRMQLLKKTVIIICVFASITWINTMTNLIDNPYLARSIKSGGEVTIALKKNGVGGYEFIYFCAVLGIMMFLVFWKYRKLTCLFGFALAFLISVMSNYMTAVLVLVIGCVISILSGRTVKKKLIGILLIFSLAIIFRYFGEIIVNFIVNLSADGRIARLLESSDKGLIQGIVDEFQGDRLPTILSSINVIFEYYGMGVYLQPSEQILATLGQHSYVLDTFAIMGVPLGILYFYSIVKSISYNEVSVIISTIILLILNNATTSIAVAVFIIVPTIKYFAEKNTLKRNTRK